MTSDSDSRELLLDGFLSSSNLFMSETFIEYLRYSEKHWLYSRGL